jgi:hypothetical protein
MSAMKLTLYAWRTWGLRRSLCGVVWAEDRAAAKAIVSDHVNDENPDWDVPCHASQVNVFDLKRPESPEVEIFDDGKEGPP